MQKGAANDAHVTDLEAQIFSKNPQCAHAFQINQSSGFALKQYVLHLPDLYFDEREKWFIGFHLNTKRLRLGRRGRTGVWILQENTSLQKHMLW